MYINEPLVLSVSQVNRYVKARLDEDQNLTNIFLTGEISNFTYHFKTGHLYFSLKDDKAAIKAVMFSSNAAKLKFHAENGLHVLVRGRISLYEATGQYQLYVDDMQPEGIGALHLAFEQTKEKLAKLGYFDAEHKKPIPAYPKAIGVVTSSVGAALQDILNILKRRFPSVQVILAPSKVQGEGAHNDLIHAIQALNQIENVDVIIIGRGGGSMEDLWEFNHEDLAKAIYESKVPIISAVGHETDFTIADFVADLRASTPSAAAELAVPNRQDQLFLCKELFNRAKKALDVSIHLQKSNLLPYQKQAYIQKINQYFDSKKMEISEFSNCLGLLEKEKISNLAAEFTSTVSKLDALSPLSVLKRGYAIAQISQKHRIHSIKDVHVQDEIDLTLSDGILNCTVKEIRSI